LALPLAAGGQYQRLSTLVDLPLLASLSQGAYYLIVQADALGVQPESSETNNVFASVTPINISFPPLPDLRAASITVEEAAAGTLTSGGPMTIRWQTRNDGSAPVSSLFHERILVTNAGQTVLNTVVTYDATGSGSLAAGAAASRSFNFTLPDGALGAGTLSVSITTDWNNEVVEGFSSSAAETNNTASANFAANLRPYADLVVANLAVSPTTVQTGQAVNVTWQTSNTGTAAVSTGFSERVKIVNTTSGAVLVNQTLGYDLGAGGPIEAGGTRNRSLSVVVPDGTASVAACR